MRASNIIRPVAPLCHRGSNPACSLPTRSSWRRAPQPPENILCTRSARCAQAVRARVDSTRMGSRVGPALGIGRVSKLAAGFCSNTFRPTPSAWPKEFRAAVAQVLRNGRWPWSGCKPSWLVPVWLGWLVPERWRALGVRTAPEPRFAFGAGFVVATSMCRLSSLRPRTGCWTKMECEWWSFQLG